MPSASKTLATAIMGLASAGRRLKPWLQRGANLARAGLVAVTWHGWRRRDLWVKSGQRLLWWGALGLLMLGGQEVLGLGPLPARWLVLAPFVAGVAICALLRLSAHRQIRVGALALGTLHGIAAVLVWTAFGG